MSSSFQHFPAPAKINLFLHVTGRRNDGYHLLQSVFRLLDFHDEVLLRVRDDGRILRVNDTPGVPLEQDLCIRAARLLQQYTGCKLGVDIDLIKRIPIGGGLGGGSSNAATTLLALNQLWDLQLPRSTLQTLGLQLGADVPVFVYGCDAWAEGVGEALQALSLPAAHYVVLTPRVHVSTAQVFGSKELTRDTIATTMAAFSESQISKGVSDNGFKNDLETVVCQQYPAVAASLKWLSRFAPARMSGSGASVFAAFSSRDQAAAVLQQAQQDEGLQNNIAVSGFCASSLQQHPLYNLAK